MFHCCFTTRQQDNPSSYDSPAPHLLPINLSGLCWALLSRTCFIVALQLGSETIRPAMTVHLHLPALDLYWVLLSSACFIVASQLGSKTIRPAMRAQLHLPPLNLSWVLLSSACFIVASKLGSKTIRPARRESPSPPPCSRSLLNFTVSLPVRCQDVCSSGDMRRTHFSGRTSIWPRYAACTGLDFWPCFVQSVLLTLTHETQFEKQNKKHQHQINENILKLNIYF